MAFSGTRSAILAALASLLLPDGLGNLQLSQSPPQFDNSLKVASTAFAQAIGVNFTTQVAVSASRTLLASDIGALLLNNANNTISIPPPSAIGGGLAPGKSFTVTNYGGNTCTLVFIGGAQYTYGNTSLTANLPVQAGESITFVSAGGSVWTVTNSTAAMSHLGSFGAVGSSSGYQKLPSGIIFQWLTAGGGTGAGDVMGLPIAFPGGAIFGMASDSGAGIHACAVASFPTLGTVQLYGGIPGTPQYVTTTYRIFAIGF